MNLLLLRFALSLATAAALMLGLLLLPAGTWSWGRAWVLVMTVIGAWLAMGVWMWRHDRDLLAERLKPALQGGQPFTDKIAISLSVALAMMWLAFIALEVHHLRWLPSPPYWLSGAGLGAVGFALWLGFLPLQQNRYLATAVRMQTERGHRLVDRGVYALVRHPLYASFIPGAIGTALWLECFAGLFAATVPLMALVWRLRVEESFLVRNLEGYRAYMQRVPYRLIPGLW